MKTRIPIIVEGGLVSGVHADKPLPDVEIEVLDLDGDDAKENKARIEIVREDLPMLW